METGSFVLYPDFDKFLTDSPLSPEQLLNRDRRNTIVSILNESTAEKYYTEKRIFSDISDTVSASQILFYICSSSEQNQTTIQLLSKEFRTENIRRTDRIEDKIVQLELFSNTIVFRIENTTINKYTTEKYTS